MYQKIYYKKPTKKNMISEHVLDDFNDDEKNNISEVTNNIIKSLPILIDKKLELFSSKVNES